MELASHPKMLLKEVMDAKRKQVNAFILHFPPMFWASKVADLTLFKPENEQWNKKAKEHVEHCVSLKHIGTINHAYQLLTILDSSIYSFNVIGKTVHHHYQ